MIVCMAFRACLVPGLAYAMPQDADAAWRSVASLPEERVYAASRTTRTSLVKLEGGGNVVRKRWTWPRRRDQLKGALRTTWVARSPARREHEALQRLRDLKGGAFAPESLGYLEHRERGVLRACMLLTGEVRNATDLARWLAASQPGAARTAVLTRLARRVRAMHDADLVDFEMHPRNVLVVKKSLEVLKVDCAKQRKRGRRLTREERAKDLAALDVGLVRYVTALDRRDFLRTYGAEPLLIAAIEAERDRIDPRESRRLPHA
jgi:hypothetical protein